LQIHGIIGAKRLLYSIAIFLPGFAGNRKIWLKLYHFACASALHGIIIFIFGKSAATEGIDMAVSNQKAIFPCSIMHVWEVVTSLENYQWRSDLSRIEILTDKQFVEYTREGYPTTFTVTRTELYQRWEFDMENSNMKGHWTGIFTEKDGHTEIDFTEEVTAKRAIMKPFVKSYLKKQQDLYIADLRKALSDGFPM